MSLSLSLSQTRPSAAAGGNGEGMLSPINIQPSHNASAPSGSRSPVPSPSPSPHPSSAAAHTKDVTDTASQASLSQGSIRARPSARTRRKAVAEAANAEPGASNVQADTVAAAPVPVSAPASSTPSISHTPSRPPSIPSHMARQTTGPSAAGVDSTISGIVSSTAARSDNRSAASRASRSSRSPGPAVEYIDPTRSSLSTFLFEGSGEFLVWSHHQPDSDTITVIMLQQTPSSHFRIYRCTDVLTKLRPHGLYMAGLKDEEYRNYVINGLAEQDKTIGNYEYEFLTQEKAAEEEGEDDRPEEMSEDGNASRTSARGASLKLYKLMGDERTRVPVCIAHLRFQPLHFMPDRPEREDELEYEHGAAALAAALCDWFARLKKRNGSYKRLLAQQSEEMKFADSLLAFPPPNGTGDLAIVYDDLLQRCVKVLNAKKEDIRAAREENEKIRMEIEASKPKPAVKEEEDDSSSESEDEEMDAEIKSLHPPIAQVPIDEHEKEDEETHLVMPPSPDGMDAGHASPHSPDTFPESPSNTAQTCAYKSILIMADKENTCHLDQLLHAMLEAYPSVLFAMSGLSFPASIDPASAHPSLTPSLLPSVAPMSPPVTSFTASPSQQARGSATQELDLSPPKARPIVRKRARIIAAPATSPSPSTPSYPPSSQSSSRRPSAAGMIPTTVAAAAAAAAAPAASQKREEEKASQPQRNTKRMRTQPSMHTSRMLSRLE